MAVLTIRPTSDVLTTNWYGWGSGGAASYVYVDESSKNEADYNNTLTTNDTVLYGFSNHTTESGTISKITLKSYLKYNVFDGSGKAKLAVKIGSTIYYSSELTLTNSFALYTWEMTVKPSDSSAWTWTNVDDFIGGCVCTAMTGKLQSIMDCMTYADVDYTESAANFIYDKMRCLYVPTFGGIR